ncbi:MAG TPA: S53 family peptidase [Segeticoccus sp.]|uniref:S53 family peptidase n=1 Tax=Segeticoccus sp. TaxID=2706531 RepID=UPI002D7FE92C|nr:S53 family peptidase [Segeticoccus sp.]HET8600475.1 S53 family peptidase [Segeticoccus sp.]
MTPAIGVTPHYRLAGSAENAPAGTTFGCQTTQPAGCYGPDQIRAAYGVNTLAARGLDGRGRTIVIVDAYSSPTIRQDLATFNELFGLPSADFRQVAPDGLTPFDQSDTNQVGWAGEITLDVEWSHAIAPKADLVLVLAKSNQDADILSATRYAVNHDLGDVISQSFGEAEQCMDPQLLKEQRNLFQQATRKHITLLASSGDEGSAQPTCDGSSFFKAASTPASDPDVTGVGGTRLFADGLTGAYDSESVWNEPEFEAAGGGGFSAVYGTPSYQKSMHLPSRGVPDVADNAAIIGGVLAVWSTSGRGAGLVFRFGGTSAGSPQWAGLVALADQLGGRRIGMMNHKLYGLAHAQKRYAANLHDITMGDNTFHGPVTISGFAAQRGWDAASGLGSPKADHLVPTLAGGR